MFTIPLLPLAQASLVGLDTAVLILVVCALVILGKIVLDLKAEVAALKNASKDAPAPAVPAATTAAPAAAPAPETGGVSAEIFATIAAAIYATQGKHYRVIAVSPVQSLLWSREGRRQVFDSHKVR